VDSEHLYMKNSSLSKVLGVRKVILKMTFEKLLTLNNKLHVTDIRMNLIFGSLLTKNRFKLVFESDKFIFFKNRVFIGYKYVIQGLMKVNLMTIITMGGRIIIMHILLTYLSSVTYGMTS